MVAPVLTKATTSAVFARMTSRVNVVNSVRTTIAILVLVSMAVNALTERTGFSANVYPASLGLIVVSTWTNVHRILVHREPPALTVMPVTNVYVHRVAVVPNATNVSTLIMHNGLK